MGADTVTPPIRDPGVAREDSAILLHVWYQFVEGVVRSVEESDDMLAAAQAPVARLVIGMRRFDRPIEHWVRGGEIHQRIVRAFTRLYYQLVLGLRERRPISNIDIDSLVDVEVMQGSRAVAAANRARVDGWTQRLQDRVARTSPSPSDASIETAEARIAELTALILAAPYPRDDQGRPDHQH